MIKHGAYIKRIPPNNLKDVIHYIEIAKNNPLLSLVRFLD